MQHDATPHIDEDWHETRCAGSAQTTKSAPAGNGSDISASAHEQSLYENWSREQLADKARKLGVEGRTKMTKSQLEQALHDTGH